MTVFPQFLFEPDTPPGVACDWLNDHDLDVGFVITLVRHGLSGETIEEWFRRAGDSRGLGLLHSVDLLDVILQCDRDWHMWLAVAWSEMPRVSRYQVLEFNAWIERTVAWYVGDIAPGLRWLVENGKEPRARRGLWEWYSPSEYADGPHVLPEEVFPRRGADDLHFTCHGEYTTAMLAATTAIASATVECRTCGGTAPTVPFDCSGCGGEGRLAWLRGRVRPAEWHLP